MENKIKEINFFRNNKNKLCIVIKYDDGTETMKKLNQKDKDTLFFALTDIMIFNKYK